jgi:hypothetical protein
MLTGGIKHAVRSRPGIGAPVVAAQVSCRNGRHKGEGLVRALSQIAILEASGDEVRPKHH